MARAEAMLTRVANTRRAAPQPMVMTGPRGLGKTVTLGEIAATAGARGFVVCPVAFDAVSDNTQLLALTLAKSTAPLMRKGSRAAQAFVRRLAALSIELNAGVVRITSPASAQFAPPSDANARQVLGDLLGKAAFLATDRDRLGLVVLIDELQEATRHQLVTVCNAIQDTTDAPLAVFMAGLPTTPDKLMSAASFSERFDYQELTRLDDAAAERALVEPSVAVGVRWEPEAVRLTLIEASGSPYMIQKLGDEAWSAAAQPGGPIDSCAAITAIDRTRHDLGVGMFRGRWAKASPRERELITAIACVADDAGVARTADIVRLLHTTTPRLSQTRRSLLDKDLIESPGRGLVCFTMPAFGDYVLETTGVARSGPGMPPQG
ncbi:MAG: ATP-binding protein [Actinomycetia bacterium]|nr:ATP-binding protein [Actinomycetes bacterium]